MLLFIMVFVSLFVLALRLWIQFLAIEPKNNKYVRRSKQIMIIGYILGGLGCLVMLAGLITPIKEIVVLGITFTATSIPMAAQAEVLGSSEKKISTLKREIKRAAIIWAVIGIIGIVVTLIIYLT